MRTADIFFSRVLRELLGLADTHRLCSFRLFHINQLLKGMAGAYR